MLQRRVQVQLDDLTVPVENPVTEIDWRNDAILRAPNCAAGRWFAFYRHI